MPITIDFTNFIALGSQNPIFLAGYIFANGGWTILIVMFLSAIWMMRLENVRMKFRKSIKYVILAIDVPKENEQSLKAVEQIFAQLSGIKSMETLYEKYWLGKLQMTISLELVSIEGYIQFLIRTPDVHRDMAEAAVYAQYPDAEITEVNDYVDEIPSIYPDKDYEIWGSEITLMKNQAYPIRTYMAFEHGLTQTFADPMASILEVMSRLRPGEQIWLQLVLTPADSNWTENGLNIVKKIIGQKVTPKKSILTSIAPVTGVFKGFGDEALKQIMGSGLAENKKPEKELPSLMQHLSPQEKRIVEGVTEKISKIGFYTKFRVIYAAKKEMYDKNRGVYPVLGAISQYNYYDLNGFKTHKRTKTSAEYFRKKPRLAYKRRKIIRAYKRRANWLGMGKGFILNIEELASIYHFPIYTITAPLVKKTEIKKAGPPPSLPIESTFTPIAPVGTKKTGSAQNSAKSGPPQNLPISIEEISNDQSNQPK